MCQPEMETLLDRHWLAQVRNVASLLAQAPSYKKALVLRQRPEAKTAAERS